jgi:hypothetical protein
MEFVDVFEMGRRWREMRSSMRSMSFEKDASKTLIQWVFFYNASRSEKDIYATKTRNIAHLDRTEVRSYLAPGLTALSSSWRTKTRQATWLCQGQPITGLPRAVVFGCIFDVITSNT